MAEPRRADPVITAPTGAAARAAAACAIHAVLDQGRSLTDALQMLSPTGRRARPPLVHEIGYGVLRTLPRQEALAKLLLHKPLKREDADVHALILVGLYQLTDTRIPPHAAVAATVEAARTIGKGWGASLLNAVLRRFERERTRLLARAEKTAHTQGLFPRWLSERIQAAWPEHWRRSSKPATPARPCACGLTQPGPRGPNTHNASAQPV